MSACPDRELLLQADLDGELGAAESAALEAHVAVCGECAAARASLLLLRSALRGTFQAEGAPASLRASVERLARPVRPRRWGFAAGGFASGLALAASVLLAVMPGAGPDAADEAVAAHVRALQPGHLLDVTQSNQHVVKPWFNGRIDLAPPVKDLSGHGFPLLGGRLDVIGGRPAAVVVYGRERHLIDLFVSPRGSAPPAEASARAGFNVMAWQAGDLELRAVSDLNATELKQFRDAWLAAD